MILASKEQIEKYTQMGMWRKEKTNLDDLRRNVRVNPERIAIIDPPNKESLVGLKPEKITYKEFGRAVDAMATALIDMGIKKDDHIVVQIPNIWELAMIHFAIIRAGADISPLPMQWRQREVGYIGDLTKASAYIAAEEFKRFKHVEMGKELQSKVPSLKHIISLEEIREMTKGEVDKERLDEIKTDPNDIFYIQWTSGTETDPKGCPFSHNIVHFMNNVTALLYQYRDGERLLLPDPLVNMTAEHVFMGWFTNAAATIVLHHPFDPEVYLQQLIQEKINATLMVPAMLVMIVKHPKVDEFDFSSLRTVITGSAPVAPFVLEEFKRRWGIEVVNTWGQNEGTGSVSSALVTSLKDRESIPYYNKRAGVWPSLLTDAIEMKVVDVDTGEEITEVGKTGELLFRAPLTIPCYFNRPDMTEAAFEPDGYFHTGDLFEIGEKGLIKYFDRKKDIIIRGGFNVSAQDVENMVQGHPKVVDAAAVAMPDERLGEKTCIYVVPKKGETVTLEEITSFMREQGIAVYKLPERLEITDRILRNPLGKIMKKEMREDIREKLRKEGKIST